MEHRCNCCADTFDCWETRVERDVLVCESRCQSCAYAGLDPKDRPAELDLPADRVDVVLRPPALVFGRPTLFGRPVLMTRAAAYHGPVRRLAFDAVPTWPDDPEAA